MKWYGIEVKKFCGALVGSEITIAPDFNIFIDKVKRVFNVLAIDNDVDSFDIKLNKNKKAFCVNVNTYDVEIVNVCFTRPKRQFFVNHQEEV